MRVKPIKQFLTALTPPPDKSITIRALIMGLLASGTTYVYNPLVSGDTVSALGAVSALGGEVDFRGGVITIKGAGSLLDCTVDAGNSATALRLLMGAVAGQNVTVKFTGRCSDSYSDNQSRNNRANNREYNLRHGFCQKDGFRRDRHALQYPKVFTFQRERRNREHCR